MDFFSFNCMFYNLKIFLGDVKAFLNHKLLFVNYKFNRVEFSHVQYRIVYDNNVSLMMRFLVLQEQAQGFLSWFSLFFYILPFTLIFPLFLFYIFTIAGVARDVIGVCVGIHYKLRYTCGYLKYAVSRHIYYFSLDAFFYYRYMIAGFDSLTIWIACKKNLVTFFYNSCNFQPFQIIFTLNIFNTCALG